MSILLHLETSTKACSVALSRNGLLIALKESVDDEYAHGEKLTLYIQHVLNESGVAMNQLNAVSVASGPGSYTGLRIGVSTAKGLCFALGIPLISVNSLISLATIGKEKHPGKRLCPLIDARRMEVFSAIYDDSLREIKPISADIIDTNSYSELEPFVFFGDGSAKLLDCWSERNLTGDLLIHASAKGQIPLSYEKYLLQEFENVAYFEPFYLKDFIQTTAKKII
jgi:tRNA threonylcarbamoyladenosine biosynthesis protein TsaB